MQTPAILRKKAKSQKNTEVSELDSALYAARARRAVSLMIIGMIVVIATGFFTEKTFLAHRGLKCITLPIILYFYLNRPDPKLREIYGSLSPIASGWALAGFFFTLVSSFKYGGYGLFIALLSSTFIYIRPLPLLKQLYAKRLEGGVIFLAAVSGPLLVVLHRVIWEPIAIFHLYIMELWMTLFYTRLHILTKEDVTGNGSFRKLAREVGAIHNHYNRGSNDFAAIVADHHHLHFTPGNNMMNAYFLFVVLLGIIILKKDSLLKLVSLKKTIILMLISIMLFTPLAMTILFMITQSGEAKDAGMVTAWLAEISDKNASAAWGWLGYLLVECLLFYGVFMLFGKKQKNTYTSATSQSIE